MSLSKYPEKLDLFQVKRDAAFDGDPNGDDVMADDINALQDSISSIQNALGTNPQGSKLNVGERISLLEGSAALRVPSFLIYLGQADKINGATSVDQAAGHFVKFDHIVLGNNAEDITNESHETTKSVIEATRKNREIKVYGYIDCSVNTTNLSMPEIQVKIQAWEDMGADGIYCDNFGYESGVSRDRQNEILDSIHQYGMIAIMQSADSEKLLTDAFDEAMNPDWIAPHIEDGDVYHYQQFAVDTASAGKYTDTNALVQKMTSLYNHRSELGIRIFATPYIASNTDSVLAQSYYEWAHAAALLTSADAFYPVSEGYAKLTDTVPTYNWTPITGNWYMSRPIIDIDTQSNTFSRETAFGKITMNNADHTHKYDGLYIPFELLQIALNSIDGSLLKDTTIEDKKIKSYSGQRLVDAINSDTSAKTIDIKHIATFAYGDITGSVPKDALAVNVVDAINAYIGTATIDQAYIGELNANKITAGTIDAGRITASVVDALNLYAQNMQVGSAKIGEAVIGNLSAEKITAGNIDAARIQANVVSAINVNAQGANIQNLNANHISAGDISADRIKTNIVNAINAYAEQMVAGSATINVATIGALTAQHIQAAVINAINISTDMATINNAKIGSLSVDNMKAAVVEAINLKSTNAQIDQARIGNLDATKITTGTLDADIIKGSVIDAMQLYADELGTQAKPIPNAVIQNLSADQITTGSISADLMQSNVIQAMQLYADALGSAAQPIPNAVIKDLSADQITSGNIATDRLKANIVNAVNAYAQTMVADSAKINSAAMGVLSAEHMQAKVLSAINASIETISGKQATIDAAKIGELTADHIQASVIAAVNANIGVASIDQGVIGDLDADKITTGSLKAEVMETNVIHAINGDFDNATIQAAKIGSLTATNIQAEVIKAINASVENITIDTGKIGTLDVDNLTASVISAVNASIETVTINAGKIGTLEVDNLKAAVINAINASVENIKIGNGMIDNLTAGHIQAVVIEAINGHINSATIDAAKIGVLEAANIKAGIITSDMINTAGLKAEQITSGFISAQRINTDTIKANMIAADQIQTKHMQAGSIDGDRISAGTLNADRLIAGTLDANLIKAGSITSELIAAGGVTARNIAANSITADMIQVGQISAEHISTKGLDAQNIQVFNGKTGEVLIGAGYLRVDGLDVGVVQSDNLIGNGAFITASSSYGYLRDNPSGEAILGGQSTAPGGHQLWKISLADGTVFPIDLGGKKPVDFAIDTTGAFGYVTMQGDDTLVQIDLANNVRTGATENMGKGPGKIYFAGDELDDHKHMLVLNQDPDDVNIPDSLTVVDAPPTSINQALYNHHFIPIGNTPWDIVTNEEHQTFITLASSGDIAVVNMANLDSIHWRVVKNISIAAYMTDNYHGGLPGEFGLGVVTGGDSSAQFNTGMQDMQATGMDPHGGYGVSDGTMITYEPHGIALSADPDHLYVADYANGYLIIVDKEGKAPYNGLSGSRQTGNLGSMGIPQGMGPGTPMSSDSPDGSPEIFQAPTYPDGSSGGGMVMSTDEPKFVAMDTSMNMGGSTEVTTPGGRTFTKDQTQHTTRNVRYRIPVGNSPEDVIVANGYVFVTIEGEGTVAFISEQDIINEIADDRVYYQGWDVFTDMKTLPMWNVGHISIGSKPGDMTFCSQTGELFVVAKGQNQVVVIDTNAIDPMNPDAAVVRRINTGANPRGLAIDKNCEYLYVVNHGGTGDFSFVYPNNISYIGDPYIGLEGGVEYQGSQYWAPNRGQWVTNANGEIVAASTVEFHVNEPFLNEGGYVKLTAYNDGKDAQWAYVEQDIVNVTNYSNGNNVRHVVGEKLTPNSTYTWFMPSDPWLKDPGVSNVKIKGVIKGETLARQGDNRTFIASKKWMATPQPPTFEKVLADGTILAIESSSYTITYPTTDSGVAQIVFNTAVEVGANIIAIQYYWWQTATGYTVEYDNGAYIQFPLGTIPQDDSQWVEADYTAKYNMWFKPHNGSIEVAVEQGSSDNFYTKFEIDEFVPKYITYDNQQTSDFTYSPIAHAGTNANYSGIEYSEMTNRALGAAITSSAAPVAGTYADIVDGKEPDMSSEENMAMSVGEPTFVAMHSYGTEVQFPSGLQWVSVDLGNTYMIGHVVIMHSFHKNRIYHGTKTQVSADGVNWTTIFDSAVSGEYREYTVDDTGMYMYGNHIHFDQRPVRYIRDYANGYTEYTKDATTGDWTTPVEYTDNYWTEIKAFGDWEFDTQYAFPDSAPNAGEQMAANGKGLVSTDVSGAWAAIDISIDFTSKWYMTYLIGPEFGIAEVVMSSMMGMSHSLTMEGPTLTKFQHKHVMYWPPSANVKDDPMNNVKAGKHRATIRQKSGRINIDTFRFEDYQYYDRNSQSITADKSAAFRRTKIVPTSAQWYIGDTIQSSEGAYNSPRLNPDTGLPDYSVAIKYRMRFRVDLSQGATLSDGTKKPGRGIAYATSAIFETGKLSTHWRRSEASDKVPGSQIEAWDGNNPHKTGIQNFHLANGAVKGNKIAPLVIMDHHINGYARISEAKLKLNYPTHRHGRAIYAPHPLDANAQIEVAFIPNNDTLDSIEGWYVCPDHADGTPCTVCGTSNTLARGDHSHDEIKNDLAITGNLNVSGTVNGVDIATLKSNYDTTVKVVNAPTALTLTESGATVNVGFTLSTSTEVTEYEIWSSIGDTTHYKLIALVNKADTSGTTYTFVDDTYTRKTTIYYRIYAKNGSVRSAALTGSIALAGTVADPTSLQVVANIDSFEIHYVVPNDRRLLKVELLVGANAVEANLTEASATIVYSGLSSHYTYKIPSADYDKFHNVWVRSVTRT